MLTRIHHTNRLRKDDSGGIATVELLLIATVLVIGLVAGMGASRDAILSELSDMGGAMQDLSQAYIVQGLVGHSSGSPGMDYQDDLDFCDSIEDVAGAADNCIVFDGLPSFERALPRIAGRVSLLTFDGDTNDTSNEGQNNDGTLVGDATIVDGVLELDGTGDFVAISDSDDINLGIQDERTIALDFIANDVSGRQVLYEEGAGVRGLVIYIDDGNLYVGGWNIPASESGWAPTYISTPITAGELNSVALVLDGTNTIQPGALTGYLNGTAFGTAPGSQLWSHSGNIGLGAINQTTIFHDGPQASGAFFNGSIDNFNLYNVPLSESEVQALVP